MSPGSSGPSGKAVATKKSLPLIGLAALALVGAIGFQSLHAPSHSDPPLSQSQQLARTAAFAQAGALVLPLVAKGDQEAALASMHLAPDQATELTKRVDDGTAKLAWLTLWDDMDEDGDTVSVQSYGVVQTIRLTNAPQRIAIAMPDNGVVNLHGVYDGGGGITVGVISGSNRVAVPVMTVGQTLGIPVAPQ